MTRTEFDAAWRELQRANTRGTNTDCIRCERCTACTASTFCVDAKNLVRCHYCVQSERLVACTHCRSSQDLFGCTHCTACLRCQNSSYLTRCEDCTDCSYCFGCIGLSGKDFHILNVPYDRAAYFKRVSELTEALGMARP